MPVSAMVDFDLWKPASTSMCLLDAKTSQPRFGPAIRKCSSQVNSKGTLRCLIIRHYLNSCVWNKIALESTPQLLNKIGQVTFTMTSLNPQGKLTWISNFEFGYL